MRGVQERITSSGPEQWLPAPGYEGLYEVSDCGRVRSLDRAGKINPNRIYRGRLLAPFPDKDGYPRVNLYKNRKMKLCIVHRLVLAAFVGPCPDGMEACHFPNPDKGDCRLANLRWDTRAANHEDKVKHGVAMLGERNHAAKLTDNDVRAIRTSKQTLASLARKYGVWESTVFNARSGITWRHVS